MSEDRSIVPEDEAQSPFAAADGVFAEDVVKDVTEDYERRREARRPLELQWRLNMNFVEGNQYCEILPGGEIGEGNSRYFWQEREVYNHIASIVETRQSKLSRTKVGVTVMPFSSDDADTGAAKLSTALIKAVTEQNGMPRLINKAIGWSEVTGSCFFKTVWDGALGEVVGFDEGGGEIRAGEARITVVPPFEIFPDDVCSPIDECRSIIHAKAYSVAEIKDLWDVEVEGTEVDVFSLDGATPGRGNALGVTSTTVPDHCVVIERYTLPSRSKPQGELAIVAGGKLLHLGALPFVTGEHGQRGFPFSQMKCLEKTGCFFGTSVVERMIPLQRSYNAVKNRKHEFMNRIAMGVLLVEDGSVDIDNLEEEGLSPGKVLVYRQGADKPRFMDAGNVPTDFRYEEERLLSEFITISGVSELSKYSQTYGSMSGTAISLLVEQDDTRLAITSDSIRLCVKDVCAKIVRLYKQFGTGVRFKRLAGENGEPELTYFTASIAKTSSTTLSRAAATWCSNSSAWECSRTKTGASTAAPRSRSSRCSGWAIGRADATSTSVRERGRCAKISRSAKSRLPYANTTTTRLTSQNTSRRCSKTASLATSRSMTRWTST